MDFKTPNKSWPFKKLMRLSKDELFKFAVSYDESVKHAGVDYFNKVVLCDIINFELLKIEYNNYDPDLPTFLGGPEK